MTAVADPSTPSLEDFRAEAAGFLDANAEKRPPAEEFVWGKGSDSVGAFEDRNRDDEMEALAAARVWRATRDDNGLGWITGPTEYGGRALSPAHQKTYDRLEAQYQVPGQSFFGIGLGMVAPTILAHGSNAAREAYLHKMYRGDIVACQLFSEPGAGSDLASLQTRAVRDGDEWILDGQKVWTSGAQYSDIGEIIARTDPELPKHRGLTGFVVDMRAPGVEIRPLRQMTGGAAFNEVFFTDVRVSDDHRLGDVNNGWNVALTTLMNERASIGASSGPGGVSPIVRLIEMARHFGVANDPLIRQRLAGLVMHSRVQSYTNQRALAKIRAGQLPGPELSMAKLAGSQLNTAVGEVAAEILGPRITADTGEWGTFAWSLLVTSAPGLRIAGGSDEVMRNIVGERVLGLPKEPGIDTTSPFKDLNVGTRAST